MANFRNMFCLISLTGLMLLTRVHISNEFFHFWDASWAVFFLAGRWLGKHSIFVLLMLVACLIDAWVLGWQGLSHACLTYGYGFLIPAYAALFYVGRVRVAQKKGFQTIFVAFSCLVAFIISNLGYFLFAPDVAEMGMVAYAAKVIPYFYSYLGVCLFYVFMSMVCASCVRKLRYSSAKAIFVSKASVSSI